MLVTKQRIANNSIEDDYSKSVSIEHRKKFVQLFTPSPIADLMAQWIIGNKNHKTILEPAFGLGVFSRAILNHKEDVEINGFEIDANIFENAKQHFEDTESVNLLLKDYLFKTVYFPAHN